MRRLITASCALALCMSLTLIPTFAQDVDKEKKEGRTKAEEKKETYSFQAKYEKDAVFTMLSTTTSTITQTMTAPNGATNSQEMEQKMQSMMEYRVLEVAEDGSLTSFRAHWYSASTEIVDMQPETDSKLVGLVIDYTWDAETEKWKGKIGEDNTCDNADLADAMLSTQGHAFPMWTQLFPSEAVAVEDTWETDEDDLALMQDAANMAVVEQNMQMTLSDLTGEMSLSGVDEITADDTDDEEFVGKYAMVEGTLSNKSEVALQGGISLSGDFTSTLNTTWNLSKGRPTWTESTETFELSGNVMGQDLKVSGEGVKNVIWYKSSAEEISKMLEENAEEDDESEEEGGNSDKGSKEKAE